MSNNKDLKNQIDYYKSRNFTFVFLIVNPITAIISKLIIEEFKLNRSPILIVSFRQTTTDLFKYPSISINIKRFEAIKQKLLFYSVGGREILSHLENQFILFSSWAFRESNWLIKSRRCIGHYYIEEGQGSYMPYQPFNYKKISTWTFIKNNFKNRVIDGKGVGFFYRDDSLGFLALNPNSFPRINESKKFILKNFSLLKNSYAPKLLGVKNIALGCAERRLKNNDWKSMILILIKALPNGGLIKLHPSFYVSDKKIKKITSYLLKETNNHIRLCANEVILEIEMLFEKKNILGPQTSLSFYAEFFGSNFKLIKLY